MRIGAAFFTMMLVAPSAAASIDGLIAHDAVRTTLIRREVDPEVPSHEAEHGDENHATISVQHGRHEGREKIERQAQWAERIERHEARAGEMSVTNTSSTTKDIIKDFFTAVTTKMISLSGAGRPSNARLEEREEITGNEKILYDYIPGDIVDGASKEWLFEGKPKGEGNAKWLVNVDYKASLAVVGSATDAADVYKYVYSDQYAGCNYKVFGTPTGQVIGAHIYRGEHDSAVQAMDKYAKDEKWVELHAVIETKGIGIKYDTIATFTQLYKGVVKSLRIGTKGVDQTLQAGIITHVSAIESKLKYNEGKWA